MIKTERKVLWVVSSLVLLATTLSGFANESEAVDRNYRVIVDRNPFGLKPPPPPPTNTPAATQTKDEIFLTGINTFGVPRAYFMSKPPQAKEPVLYELRVDQEKDGLAVLEIDRQGKSVRVRRSGVETVMTFAANGVKPPAAPATGAPGAPGVSTPGGTPLPGAVAAGGLPQATPGFGTAGSRISTTSGFGTTPSAGRVARTIPSRIVRAPNFPGGVTPAPPVMQSDPTASLRDAALMEIQRTANPNIPLPPTPMPP